MKPADWTRAGYTVKDGTLVKSASPFLNAVPVHPEPKKKRIRQSAKPILNQLEQEFFDNLQRRNERGYRITCQNIRFKLANGIWYKPDMILWGQIVRVYEVKGPHSFRGGFENLKVAANRYDWFSWWLVWKENGQWQEQQVLP